MLLSPWPVAKFFDNDGKPLVGGLVFTYEAGTTTPIVTYIDAEGSQENTNPIVLDFRGEARIWLVQGTAYKYVVSPSTDTDPPTNPIQTIDNISIPASSTGVVGPRAIGRWTATLDEEQTEGVDDILWDCAFPGVYEVVFTPGLFSTAPIVTATTTIELPIEVLGGIANIDEVTTASVIIRTFDATGAPIDCGVHFHAFQIV